MKTLTQTATAERLGVTRSEIGRLMIRGLLHEIDRRGAQRHVTVASVEAYERVRR